MQKKYYFSIVLGLLLFFAAHAHAAVMTVSPPRVVNGAETVAVELDTQGQSVNALEAHLTFNPSEFSISGITDGGSIIDLWIQPPIFSNSAGTVDFSGIIPGGVEAADGTVILISIVPQENGPSAGFQVASATALLNDGGGTPAALTIMSGPFSMAIPSSVPSFVPAPPPDAFTPKVSRDPLIFNDQYFLSFATTDEGPGIDHYEVLEVPTGVGSAKSSGWQDAQSPYLLKDQTLSSNIYVRAVDKAGNFRLEEVPAAHDLSKGPTGWNDAALALGVIVLLLIIAGIMRRIVKWKRKKRS